MPPPRWTMATSSRTALGLLVGSALMESAHLVYLARTQMTRNLLLSGTRHVPADLCLKDVLADTPTVNSPHTAN